MGKVIGKKVMFLFLLLKERQIVAIVHNNKYPANNSFTFFLTSSVDKWNIFFKKDTYKKVVSNG